MHTQGQKKKKPNRVYPERKSQRDLGKKLQGHHDRQESWASGYAMCLVLEDGKGLQRVPVGGARQMASPMMATCDWTIDSETECQYREWKWKMGIGPSMKPRRQQILPGR